MPKQITHTAPMSSKHRVVEEQLFGRAAFTEVEQERVAQDAEHERDDGELEPQRVPRCGRRPRTPIGNRRGSRSSTRPRARIRGRPRSTARASGGAGSRSSPSSVCSAERLPGDDEQRARRGDDQEPVADRHADGDAAGDRPQHESRGDGREVEDRLVLQPGAVRERDQHVAADHQRKVPGRGERRARSRRRAAPSRRAARSAPRPHPMQSAANASSGACGRLRSRASRSSSRCRWPRGRSRRTRSTS